MTAAAVIAFVVLLVASRFVIERYTFELATKVLGYKGRTWTYFDSARAIRQ
jgi:hypothetical protein